MNNSFVCKWLSESALFVSMLAVVSGGVMSSCSSDDDDDSTSFETPKYEAEAAKYSITDASSTYESIELTASGNYIVITDATAASAMAKVRTSKNGMAATVMNTLKNNMLRLNCNVATRSASVYSGIFYGTYTKTADGVYELDGFGTVKVTQDAYGSAYSIEITRTGGTTETIPAKKENADKNSAKSVMLCRTWVFDSYRFVYAYNGKTYVDESASTLSALFTQIKKKLQSYDPDDDYSEFDQYAEILADVEPQNMVFTKSGTYMVSYKNKQIAVANWNWIDESAGTLGYSWGEYNGYDLDGKVTISFEKNKLQVVETNTDSDYDEEDDYTETTTATLYYNLTEMK